MSYTEDITLVGGVLARELQHLYSSVRKRAFSFAQLDEMLPCRNVVQKVEKVGLIDRFYPKRLTSGTLFITTTHLIFVTEEGKETWILHSLISSVEKGSLSAIGSPLYIRCKHFLFLGFMIPREKECHDVYTTLLQLSQPVNIEDVYAFSYVSPIKALQRGDGWNGLDVHTDYHRLGLPNEKWAQCELNLDYKLCETYPAVHLYVPRAAPTQIVIASSKFRSKNRLPVLAFLYPETGASICRCSQPLAGFSARCVEDEQLFQHIVETNRAKCSLLYIVDTRPRVNAMANKATGKGFENENYYQNMKFHFFGIENIHVMRTSLQKLVELCSQNTLTTTSFLVGLDACGWLKHVRSVLEAAVFIAESIERGISCVVHCSDGWDRTSQTISLACLLLDPFYRSIHGFQMLVEKDWLSFGHKFTDRCGHVGQSESGSKETSPIFTQFVDCVWQLMQQFPQAFQFNERFLFTVHDHVHSCQFGTFLGNCEKDRVDLKLAARTYSLWGFMSHYLDEYANANYDPQSYVARNILRPNMRPQFIRLWTGMYNRFDNGLHIRECGEDKMASIKEHVGSLEDHLSWLNKKSAELKELLGKEGTKSPSSSVMVDSGHFTSDLNASCDVVKQSDSESGIEDSQSWSIDRRFSKKLSVAYSVDAGLEGSPAAASVAIRWASTRSVGRCSAEDCAQELLHFMKKYHCWKCGKIYCYRCMEQRAALPGQQSQRLVPVCRLCYGDLKELPVVKES